MSAAAGHRPGAGVGDPPNGLARAWRRAQARTIARFFLDEGLGAAKRTESCVCGSQRAVAWSDAPRALHVHRRVAQDRPIAPSPGRLALARRAGVRAPARWLCTGLACVAASVVVQGLDLRALGDGLDIGRIGPGTTASALRRGVMAWGTLVAIAVGVALVARVLSGGMGPVDRTARAKLEAPAVRPRAILVALCAVASLGLAAALLKGVIAGAARGVDVPLESTDMVAALWAGWAARALAVVGAVLTGFGLLELTLWRAARWRALHQTVQDLRRDARDHRRKSAP